jgi:Tat protein secretion system quality control protein TatD with DNase activity
VMRTAQVLAEAMGKPEDEIGPATTKNFYRLFQLHLDVGN